jgi:hypothetical protein
MTVFRRKSPPKKESFQRPDLLQGIRGGLATALVANASLHNEACPDQVVTHPLYNQAFV